MMVRLKSLPPLQLLGQKKKLKNQYFIEEKNKTLPRAVGRIGTEKFDALIRRGGIHPCAEISDVFEPLWTKGGKMWMKEASRQDTNTPGAGGHFSRKPEGLWFSEQSHWSELNLLQGSTAPSYRLRLLNNPIDHFGSFGDLCLHSIQLLICSFLRHRRSANLFPTC